MQDGDVIDARDYGCELPVTMVRAALSKVKSGVVEILVSGEDVVQNLRRFALENSMDAAVEKSGDGRKVTITKKTKDAVPLLTAEGAGAETIFLVVSSDVLGKEEELGQVLIRSFFESMRATGIYPGFIFFVNAGVRLTTLNETVIPVLRELEQNGVEVLSCLTCLKFYGLESRLKVGKPGSMPQAVEAMKKYKLVWI